MQPATFSLLRHPARSGPPGWEEPRKGRKQLLRAPAQEDPHRKTLIESPTSGLSDAPNSTRVDVQEVRQASPRSSRLLPRKQVIRLPALDVGPAPPVPSDRRSRRNDAAPDRQAVPLLVNGHRFPRKQPFHVYSSSICPPHRVSLPHAPAHHRVRCKLHRRLSMPRAQCYSAKVKARRSSFIL